MFLISKLTSIAFFLFLGLLSSGYAEAHSSTCSTYHAVYEPHENSPNQDKSYRLTIRKNVEYLPTVGPKAFFVIETYSHDGNQLQSKFTADYNCTSGNNTRCHLQLSKRVEDKLDVQPLAEDFTPIFSYNKAAPYALIIPNAASGFNSLDWDSVEKSKIEYFTQNPIRPDLSFPPVWVISTCN